MRMRYEMDDARTNWIQVWANDEPQVNKLGTKYVNITEREFGWEYRFSWILQVSAHGLYRAFKCEKSEKKIMLSNSY